MMSLRKTSVLGLVKGGLFSRSADSSTWMLVFANISVLFFALSEDWGLGTVLWTYWLQSVIIGFINFFRILTLRDYSVEGFKSGGKQVDVSWKTNVSVAVFFALHYGFFHFIYAVFLGVDFPDSAKIGYVLLSGGVFFVTHLYSFLHNRSRDQRKMNIGRVMFFPYIRIIPMHLTIMFSGFAIVAGGFLSVIMMASGKPVAQDLSQVEASITVFFMGLKTVADVGMHVFEHRKS